MLVFFTSDDYRGQYNYKIVLINLLYNILRVIDNSLDFIFNEIKVPYEDALTALLFFFFFVLT